MALPRSTPTQRRQAALIDRERRALERPGIRAAQRQGTALRVAVMQAFEAGVRDFLPILDAAAMDLGILLAEGMIAAHLTGVLRATNAAVKEIDGVRRLQVYDGVVNVAQRRLDLTDAQLVAVSETYGPVAATGAAGLSTQLNGGLSRAMAEVSAEGLSVAEGRALIAAEFTAAGVVGRTEGGVVIGPHLHETLFRTNVQLAHSAGRWEAAQDPVIQSVLWGWTYVTVGDDRVRDEHVLLDGTTLAKEDPLWQQIWPPNGWNCRCTTIEVFAPPDAEVRPEAVEIEGVVIEPVPDPDFAFNPGVVFSGDVGPVIST